MRRDRIDRLEDRVDTIDVTARSVAVLAVQLQELSAHLARHEHAHETEATQRDSSRKWLLGTITAAGAANIGTLVTLLITHLH